MRFYSSRERKLWWCVASVIAALIASMGYAQILAGELRSRELLDATFSVGMLLVVLTVVTQGLHSRPRGLELALGFGLVAAYLFVFARLLTPEARSHLIEYSILAIFIYAALIERQSSGGPVLYPAALAIVASSMIGVLDECVQWLLPHRVFDPFDMLFNFLASLSAVTASVVVSLIRRPSAVGVERRDRA